MLPHYSHGIWNITSNPSGLFECTSPFLNSFPNRDVNTVFLKSASLIKFRSFSLMFCFAWFVHNRRIAARKVEQLHLIIDFSLAHGITRIYCLIPWNFPESLSENFSMVFVFQSWHKSIGSSIVGLWFLLLIFNKVFL